MSKIIGDNKSRKRTGNGSLFAHYLREGELRCLDHYLGLICSIYTSAESTRFDLEKNRGSVLEHIIEFTPDTMLERKVKELESSMIRFKNVIRKIDAHIVMVKHLKINQQRVDKIRLYIDEINADASVNFIQGSKSPPLKISYDGFVSSRDGKRDDPYLMKAYEKLQDTKGSPYYLNNKYQYQFETDRRERILKYCEDYDEVATRYEDYHDQIVAIWSQ
jgi:hypothetical protein